jgi:hypothetical protein
VGGHLQTVIAPYKVLPNFAQAAAQGTIGDVSLSLPQRVAAAAFTALLWIPLIGHLLLSFAYARSEAASKTSNPMMVSLVQQKNYVTGAYIQGHHLRQFELRVEGGYAVYVATRFELNPFFASETQEDGCPDTDKVLAAPLFRDAPQAVQEAVRQLLQPE